MTKLFVLIALLFSFNLQAQTCENSEHPDQLMIYMDMKEARKELAEEIARAKQEIEVAAVIARKSVESEGKHLIDQSKNLIAKATQNSLKSIALTTKKVAEDSKKITNSFQDSVLEKLDGIRKSIDSLMSK